MSTRSKSAGASPAELVHPVYLDAPMLVDFLATLDQGVSFSSEIAQKQEQGNRRGSEGSGSFGIPALAGLLGLNLSASGKLSREKNRQESSESRFVRQHTSASLFNKLRASMREKDLIKRIDDPADLANVTPGDIVELGGVVVGNPLAALLDFINSIRPFVDPAMFEQSANAENADGDYSLSLGRMFELIEMDMKRSAVVDLLLKGRISTIVTADSENFTSGVGERLLMGTFKLVGKVASVELRPDTVIPIVRRGAMGILAQRVLEDMFSNFVENLRENGVNFAIPEVVVKGPSLQVLPLAIFV